MKIIKLLPLICFVIPLSSMAQTYVNGAVSGNWTKTNSPYIVTGGIYIRWGSSLHIESGTVVRFDGAYEFNVRGLLQADGAEADSMVFTSNHPDSTWGGIRFDSAHDSSRLVYCKIENGSAKNGGGVSSDETRLRIENCLFRNNRAEGSGGGLNSNNSYVTIVNSSFIGNSAKGSGGGLFSHKGSMVDDRNTVIISNSFFRNNSASEDGGAIYAGRGTYSIHGTQFINNNADGEGGAFWGYEFLIINCTFINNTSPSASTLLASSFSDPDKRLVLNCIIYNIVESSSTVEMEYSVLMILNSILYNVNFSSQYSDFRNLIVEFCNIKGGWQGEGNIDQDPEFINPDNGDFRLRIGSPCIDAGNPHVLFNDYDGTRNDMGVYGGSALFVKPLEIDFGPKGLGQSKTEYISIYNFRNLPFTIQSARPIDESNFSVVTNFPRSIPSLTVDTVHFNFHPTLVGDIRSQFIINSVDFKGTSGLEIDVRGLGGYWAGPVSGIWRVANSPYIIGGDITIPTSESLIIEPGVVIQVDPTVAGTSARFEVYGSLEAVGTESDSIIFTLTPGQENPGLWGAWAGIDLQVSASSSKSGENIELNLGKKGGLVDDKDDDSHNEGEIGQLNKAVEQTTADHENTTDREVRDADLFFVASHAHLSFCKIEYARTAITAIHDNIIIENSHILNNGDGVKWFGDQRSASGELRNSLIEKNTGRGVFCQAKCRTEYGYANATIENNVIRQNGSGGIYLFADGDGPFSWYGTVDKAYVSPKIVGNEIYDNIGPAINCQAWGVWTDGFPLDHWSYAYVSPKISSNIIVNNGQVLNVTCPNYNHSRGRLSQAEIEIDHTTSWSNGDTEIRAADSAEVYISNSIFWGPAISNVETTTGASVEISYSDLTQDYAGAGNIHIDPGFVAPDNNNFNLLMTSPCIDTGDPNSPKDPDSTIADMGATYYHQSISDFSLSAPKDKALLVDEEVKLSWSNPVSGGGEPLTFDLFYSTDSSLDTAHTIIVREIQTNHYQFHQELEDNTIYYWKVLARNPWSLKKWSLETWQFTVRSDTIPPYFVAWHTLPANLTEDTADSFRVYVTVIDTGKGLGESVPEIAYRIGDTSYSEWSPMEFDRYDSNYADSSGIWFYVIPKYDWESYSGDTLFCQARCADVFGNLGISNEYAEWIDSINDPPFWVNLPDLGFPEDSIATLDLDDYAFDIDNDSSELDFDFSIIGFENKAKNMLAKRHNKRDNIPPNKILLGPDDLQISIDSTTHVATFTISSDSSGIFTVAFTVSDPEGLTDKDTILVGVTPVNDAPEIFDLPLISFNEDDSLHFPISNWFNYVEDIDDIDSTLVFDVHSGKNVKAILRDTVCSFYPIPNFSGEDTLQLIVSDDSPLADSAQFIVFINEINDPPLISGLPDSIVFRADSMVVLHVWEYAQDVETDDQSLHYMFMVNYNAPIGTDTLLWNFEMETGILNLSSSGFIGKVNLIITVEDDSGAIEQGSLYVRVKNISGVSYFSEHMPTHYELYQNYPNPFNLKTAIPFSLPEQCEINIKIYNLNGKLIEEVFNGKKSAGNHIIYWDAIHYSSGIYFINMNTGKYIKIMKCILLK